MSFTIGTVKIRVGADTKELANDFSKAQRIMQRSADGFKQIGSNLSTSISLPIAALGVASLKTFGDLDSLKKGLIAVMGSADAANNEFTKLREVAKLPGLGLEEAAKGSVALQSAGFSAEQARQSLSAFGNALATVGKGKNELNLVVLALTQLQNKTSGFGQDLRQLVEQLPQLRGALTNIFGTSDSEAIAKLGVTGQQVVEKLTAEFGKLPQVTGGLKNAFENASDSIKISLAKIGESVNTNLAIEGLLNSISSKITGLIDAFGELSPTAQKSILIVAGLAAALGPTLFVIGSVQSSISTAIGLFGAMATSGVAMGSKLIFALGPISATILGIGAALVAGIAIYNKYSNNAVTQYKTEKAELENLVNAAKDVNIPIESRRILYEKIQQKYPQYLKNIDLEKEGIDGLNKVLYEYNSINTLAGAQEEIRRGKVKKLTDEITDQYRNIAKIQEGILPDVLKNIGIEKAKKDIEELNAELKKLELPKAKATRGSVGGLGEFLNKDAKKIDVPIAVKAAPKEKVLKEIEQFSRDSERDAQVFKITVPVTVAEEDFKDSFESITNRFAGFSEALTVPVTMVPTEIDNPLEGAFINIKTTAQIAADIIAEKYKNLGEKISGYLDVGGAIGDKLIGVISAINTAQQTSLDNKIAKEKEAINNSITNEQEKGEALKAIDQKYAAEKTKIQRKIAIQNKAAGIFDATIAAIQGVANALKLGPVGIPLAITMGALGAAQVAAIASTPLPSLAIGTKGVLSSGLAQIHKGEAIVPAKVVSGGFGNIANNTMEIFGKVSGTDLIFSRNNAETIYSRLI